MIKPVEQSVPKGHRPPPPVTNPGEEPAVPGWIREEWHASESYQSIQQNKKLKVIYPDQSDPAIAEHWASLGIKRELFDASHDFDHRGNPKYAFSVLYPMNTAPDEKLPVLYYSHAGGANNYDAELAGFSALICTERFIAVYPENGGFSNPDVLSEFPRIMNYLEERAYPIDWSRIYAAGFSAGSDATESLGTQYADALAAIAPCPGSNAMYNSLCRTGADTYEKAAEYSLPLCFVGGTADYGDVYPFPDSECFENFNIWAQDICNIHNYTPTTIEEAKQRIAEATDPMIKNTGIVFHKTWKEKLEGRNWYFGELYNRQGHPWIRVVLAEDVPHEVTNCHVRLVWEWLKHWRRNAVTKEVEYI